LGNEFGINFRTETSFQPTQNVQRTQIFDPLYAGDSSSILRTTDLDPLYVGKSSNILSKPNSEMRSVGESSLRTPVFDPHFVENKGENPRNVMFPTSGQKDGITMHSYTPNQPAYVKTLQKTVHSGRVMNLEGLPSFKGSGNAKEWRENFLWWLKLREAPEDQYVHLACSCMDGLAKKWAMEVNASDFSWAEFVYKFNQRWVGPENESLNEASKLQKFMGLKQNFTEDLRTFLPRAQHEYEKVKHVIPAPMAINILKASFSSKELKEKLIIAGSVDDVDHLFQICFEFVDIQDQLKSLDQSYYDKGRPSPNL